jgi:hypothetical protein
VRKSTHSEIREALRKMPDGLSILDLRHMTGLCHHTLRQALVSMADVYIDRWERTSRRYVGPNPQWRAMYIAVPIPPNQPKPKNESTP